MGIEHSSTGLSGCRRALRSTVGWKPKNKRKTRHCNCKTPIEYNIQTGGFSEKGKYPPDL